MADEIGWSRTAVANYAQLAAISKDAWDVVVTTVTNCVTRKNAGDNDEDQKVVTFSEKLLRSIIPLKAEQQIKLVKQLANTSEDGTSGKPARLTQDRFAWSMLLWVWTGTRNHAIV